MKYVYNQGLRNIYWLTCQLFFVIFLKFLGIKTVAFYDRKPLNDGLMEGIGLITRLLKKIPNPREKEETRNAAFCLKKKKKKKKMA